jgi:hypothetical protein
MPVATRVDGQWLILDNRTLTLVRDTDVTRAIPEFVLDHDAVKRFNRASQSRLVSSSVLRTVLRLMRGS